MQIEISDRTFKRLQKHAQPLVHSTEDIIAKALDALEGRSAKSNDHIDLTEFMTSRPRLKGYLKELKEEVVDKIPGEYFSLGHVYDRLDLLVHRKHVQEPEASARAGLQKLRDYGYIEFCARGHYRKLYPMD